MRRPLLTNKRRETETGEEKFLFFFQQCERWGKCKEQKILSGATFEAVREDEVSMSLPSQYVICISRYVGAVSG